MKKIFILLLLLMEFTLGFSQVKMGDFPLLLGRGDSAFVPIVVGNTNRKMYGVDLAWGKVDSLIVSNDSLFQVRKGARWFVGMINGTGGGSAPIDSLAWSRINGNIFDNAALQTEFGTKQNSITPGTASQYFKGNFTLGTFETDVRAITDSFYSPIGHTHQTGDISGLGPFVRNQIYVTGNGSYDPSTGHITINNGSGTGGTFNNVLPPLSANGDTIKLLSVPASILTGTKTHTFISDWNASVLALFSANGPVQFNGGTGVISLDTTSGTGAATKLRLYKALDSSLRVNPYSPLFTGAYNDPAWITHYSYNKLIGIPPLSDSLSHYSWTVYAPLHVAWAANAIDTLFIDTVTTAHAGILLPVDFNKIQNAVPNTRTITINNQTFDLSQDRSWTITGSGTGATYLSQLLDVLLGTLHNYDGLVYDGAASKWKNQPLTQIAFTNVQSTDVIAPDGNGGLKNVPAVGINTTGAVNGMGAFWQNGQLVLQSIPANPTIVISGDVSGSGTPNITATLASILTPGTCTNCNVTFDAKGRATTYSNGSSGSGTVAIPANEIVVGTGPSVGGTTTFTWDGVKMTLGTSVASSTATPVVINMGGTFSNAAGINPKDYIYSDGANYAGLGMSAAQMDYIVSNIGYTHNFYVSTSKIFQITSAGTFVTGNASVSGNLSVNTLRTGGTAPATTGTVMMVVSDANGLVSLRSIPTGSGSGTVTNLVTPSFPASTALAATVSNPTTTPQINFTWASDNAHYVLGDGTLASKIVNVSQLTNDLQFLTANQNISLTGDATGTGNTSISVALASIIASGTCTNCNITWDAKGRIVSAATGSAGTGGDGNNYPTAVALSSSGVVTVSRNGLTDISSAAASGTWGISVTGNAATATNASQLGGVALSSAAHYWGVVPSVSAIGVMEVGEYIDLHNTTSDAADYSVRIETNGTAGLKINGTPLIMIPSTSGAVGKFLSVDNSGNVIWGGFQTPKTINTILNGYGNWVTERPDSIFFAAYSSITGTLSVSDDIGTMIRKLDGNVQLKANATGTNATGTWGISISGNAATATTATSATSAAALSTNLPVSKLNSGTNATTATLWRGDGTWSNVLTNGSSTAGNAYLTFLPSDFGVGKPEFYFQKSTNASQWDMALWDGATNTGTINFVSTALTWNGADIVYTSPAGTTGQVPVYSGIHSLTNSNLTFATAGGISRFGFNIGSPAAIVQAETSSADPYFQATRTGVIKFQVDNTGGIYSKPIDDATGVAKMVTATNGQLGIQAIPATGEINAGQNLGTGIGLYTGKSGVNLQFNNVIGGIGTVASLDATNHNVIVQNNAYDDYEQWVTLTSSASTDNHYYALTDNTTHHIEVDVVGFGGNGDVYGATYKYTVKRYLGTASLITSSVLESPNGGLSSVSGVQFAGSVQGANFQFHVANGTYPQAIQWKVVIKVNLINIRS